MKKYILITLLALAHTLFVSAQQSTIGEIPPEGIDLIGHVTKSAENITAQYVIPGVPAYYWRYGCGPTALGMVLGYYDEHGLPNIFSGSSSTQTPAVQEAIASSNHYNDYSLPLDYYPNLINDLSELPSGDEHNDNCIADYMETSQSFFGNYYGWSWSSDIINAHTQFLQNETPYTGTCQYYVFSSMSFAIFMSEMDANRPMMALVDTDEDGYTDHFITLIGYKQESGTNYYACYQTWDYNVHYYEYAQIAGGQPWGIYSLYTFTVNGESAIYEPEIEISMYPIPVSEMLSINSVELTGEYLTISFFNTTGQLVLQQENEMSGSLQVDVSGLDAGVYVLQIQYSNGVMNRQIEIE